MLAVVETPDAAPKRTKAAPVTVEIGVAVSVEITARDAIAVRPQVVASQPRSRC